MTTAAAKTAENRVRLWGGLAGMLGGLLFIAALVWVEVRLPPDPAELAAWAARFPDIRVARMVENGIYLLALILEIPLILALFWELRKTHIAPALFGSALCILGLASMIFSATPHVAHFPLSEIYHGAGATPADQAAIAIMWQATWGVFNAMLYVGFVLVSLGLTVTGIALIPAPGFGRRCGWSIVALGALGVVAGIFQLGAPASVAGAGSYFAGLISFFVLGWKLYRLSKAT